MVFTTGGFFKVAIESWPEWDLNHWIPFTRSNGLTYQAMSSLPLRANFVQLLKFHHLLGVTFHFGYCLCQSPRLFQSRFCWCNQMSVAEWIDTYGIHSWRILWSSYRKFVWVGFEPTTTEFRSHAQTDWAIRPRVQLALKANFVQLLQFRHLLSVTFHFGYSLRQSPRLF